MTWVIQRTDESYWTGNSGHLTWTTKVSEAKPFICEADAWHAGYVSGLTLLSDWRPVERDPQQEAA